MMGNEYSYIALIGGSDGNRIAVVRGKYDKFAVVPEEVASIPVATSSVWLKAELLNDHECEYSYSTDGVTYHRLGEPCAVKPGMWIGAKIGIFSSSPNVVGSDGYADFDYFRIE